MNNTQQSSLDLKTQTLNQEKVVIKCPHDHVAQSACSNKKCIQYAFTCKNSQCQCRKQHQLCFMTEIKTIDKIFTSKIYSTQSLRKLVDDEFNQIIDKISDVRDKLLYDISTIFQFYGLKQDEKKVYKMFKDQTQIDQVTGKDIWQACYNQNDQVIQNFDHLITQLYQSFNEYQKFSDRLLLEIEGNFVNYEETSTQVASSPNQKSTKKLSTTKIIKQKQKNSKNGLYYL